MEGSGYRAEEREKKNNSTFTLENRRAKATQKSLRIQWTIQCVPNAYCVAMLVMIHSGMFFFHTKFNLHHRHHYPCLHLSERASLFIITLIIWIENERPKEIEEMNKHETTFCKTKRLLLMIILFFFLFRFWNVWFSSIAAQLRTEMTSDFVSFCLFH